MKTGDDHYFDVPSPQTCGTAANVGFHWKDRSQWVTWRVKVVCSLFKRRFLVVWRLEFWSRRVAGSFAASDKLDERVEIREEAFD
jgi:hypothetical protein